jgi:hypothetical protein
MFGCALGPLRAVRRARHRVVRRVNFDHRKLARIEAQARFRACAALRVEAAGLDQRRVRPRRRSDFDRHGLSSVEVSPAIVLHVGAAHAGAARAMNVQPCAAPHWGKPGFRRICARSLYKLEAIRSRSHSLHGSCHAAVGAAEYIRTAAMPWSAGLRMDPSVGGLRAAFRPRVSHRFASPCAVLVPLRKSRQCVFASSNLT